MKRVSELVETFFGSWFLELRSQEFHFSVPSFAAEFMPIDVNNSTVDEVVVAWLFRKEPNTASCKKYKQADDNQDFDEGLLNEVVHFVLEVVNE